MERKTAPRPVARGPVPRERPHVPKPGTREEQDLQDYHDLPRLGARDCSSGAPAPERRMARRTSLARSAGACPPRSFDLRKNRTPTLGVFRADRGTARDRPSPYGEMEAAFHRRARACPSRSFDPRENRTLTNAVSHADRGMARDRPSPCNDRGGQAPALRARTKKKRGGQAPALRYLNPLCRARSPDLAQRGRELLPLLHFTKRRQHPIRRGNRTPQHTQRQRRSLTTQRNLLDLIVILDPRLR